MPSRGVCVSVCVSVTFVSCVKTNKDIFKIFSPSGSHTILVFLYQTGWRYLDGTPPLTGASNAGGVGRIAILSRCACCWRCNRQDVNMVAGGRRPPSRKLWQLYRGSYTAGIRPPSATRDKVTVSVVVQRERDQARSRTIHNHDWSCVWQQGLTLRRRQQNRIELYAVNPKLK